jgi:hypothetical protein
MENAHLYVEITFIFLCLYNMLSLKNEINFKPILRTSFVGNYYNNSNIHKIKI